MSSVFVIDLSTQVGSHWHGGIEGNIRGDLDCDGESGGFATHEYKVGPKNKQLYIGVISPVIPIYRAMYKGHNSI